LGTLRAELEKLAGLDAAEPLTRQRIGELVGVRAGETLEDWVNAILTDDTARAVTLTPGLLGLAGMTGVKMVTALGTHFICLKLARALHEKGTQGSALERMMFERIRALRVFGLGDWKVSTKLWARVAGDWNDSRLQGAVRTALEADQSLKGTRLSDVDGVMFDLALKLGASAPRRLGATAPGRHGAPQRAERPAPSDAGVQA